MPGEQASQRKRARSSEREPANQRRKTAPISSSEPPTGESRSASTVQSISTTTFGVSSPTPLHRLNAGASHNTDEARTVCAMPINVAKQQHQLLTSQNSIHLALQVTSMLDPSDGLVALVMSDAEAVTAALQHPGVQEACRGDGLQLFCLGLEPPTESSADQFPGWKILVNELLEQGVRRRDEPATMVFLSGRHQMDGLSDYMKAIMPGTTSVQPESTNPLPRRLLVMTVAEFATRGKLTHKDCCYYNTVFLDSRQIGLETLDSALQNAIQAGRKKAAFKKLQKDLRDSSPSVRYERLREWVLREFVSAKRRVQIQSEQPLLLAMLDNTNNDNSEEAEDESVTEAQIPFVSSQESSESVELPSSVSLISDEEESDIDETIVSIGNG